jgi:hypothetical protein
VPVLGTVGHHDGGCGDRLADDALVHHLAAGLEAPAEKRVGGAADQEPPLRRHLQHLSPVLAADGERLLRVDVLAGLQRRQRDLRVDRGDRQVQHDLDLGVGEKLSGV